MGSVLENLNSDPSILSLISLFHDLRTKNKEIDFRIDILSNITMTRSANILLLSTLIEQSVCSGGPIKCNSWGLTYAYSH